MAIRRLAVCISKMSSRDPDRRILIQTDVSISSPPYRYGGSSHRDPGRRGAIQAVVARRRSRSGHAGLPYRSPDRHRGIQDDGSPSRAPYGSSEQRLATASWIREQQAAVSPSSPSDRHGETPDRSSRRFGGRSGRKKEGRAELRPEETREGKNGATRRPCPTDRRARAWRGRAPHGYVAVPWTGRKEPPPTRRITPVYGERARRPM